MSEDNKAIVRRLFDEVWNKGRLEVVDELFSADFVDHDAKPALGPGKQGFKATVMMFRNAMSDLSGEIDVILGEGELVATRVRFKGTQDGMVFGFPPSRKSAVVSQVTVYKLVGGKIVALWHNADTLGMLHQFGLIAPPGPPPGVKPPAAQ